MVSLTRETFIAYCLDAKDMCSKLLTKMVTTEMSLRHNHHILLDLQPTMTNRPMAMAHQLATEAVTTTETTNHRRNLDNTTSSTSLILLLELLRNEVELKLS